MEHEINSGRLWLVYIQHRKELVALEFGIMFGTNAFTALVVTVTVQRKPRFNLSTSCWRTHDAS